MSEVDGTMIKEKALFYAEKFVNLFTKERINSLKQSDITEFF